MKSKLTNLILQCFIIIGHTLIPLTLLIMTRASNSQLLLING